MAKTHKQRRQQLMQMRGKGYGMTLQEFLRSRNELQIPSFREVTHPGEVLLLEFLKPKKLTPAAFARQLGVPVQRIQGLIGGKRNMTAVLAIRFSRALGTTSEFWMSLQSAYDLQQARTVTWGQSFSRLARRCRILS